MRNELNALEILVNELINPAGMSDLADALQAAKHKCAAVQEVWLAKIFASGNALKNKEYIQYHHRAVIRLMDKFYRFQAGDAAQAQEFNQQVFASLNSLHVFLFENFRAYIDFKSHLPLSELELFKKESLKIRSAVMRNYAKKEINEPLLTLLSTYFKAIPNLSELNFGLHDYHHFAMAELLALSQHKGYRNYNEHLVLLLLRLNFNSIAFMAYCRKLILQRVHQSDKKEMHLDTLSLYLKKVRLVQLFPDRSLRADYPQINTVLATRIQEEKLFVESKKLRAGVGVPDQEVVEKIELGFSVSQLALFIRVLVEEHLLIKTNLTKLLSFFIASFRTRNTQNISFESLRNHYYDVESGTVSSLKAKMIGIINVLNKMRE